MSGRAPYLPLEQRIGLYNEVLQLREQGQSYREIKERIHRHSGVRLSFSHISYWVRGLKTPMGNVNKFYARPSPTLAYIIGVRLGDGSAYRFEGKYNFELGSVDREFTAETGRRLAKLLGRKMTYKPRWHRGSRTWRVKCRSILLHQFLNQPFHSLRPYVQHCRDCVAAFLKGLLDSEGGIGRRKLKAFNTDFELLCYVRYLLKRYFAIETTGPRVNTEVGYRFRSPRNDKVYTNKKRCYYVYVRVRSLPRFHRYIGFTIKRKQRELIKAIQR